MNNKFEKEIEELLSQFSLEEKITIIHAAGFFRTGGVERLSVPPVMCSDGPMGVRAEFENAKWVPLGTGDDYVTYLPSNSALASTWNRKLAYETGQVLGCEARGRGKDVILAPGINIKRSPLCGRNFEYMSEDPCLIEEMTVPLIEGIQENDVAACVKHFAVNSQETDRLMVDTIVDERAMRELYLPGFKAAVQKADVLSIMGAYNKFRGVHCCENAPLLDELLRKEWGFDGTVISDWGAVHRTRESAEVSLDMEMSVTDNFDEYFFANPLMEEVKKGNIKAEYVDDKVKNVLRMMFRLKMLGSEKETRKPGTYNAPEHRQKVYAVASEAMILLKNEDGLLPLDVHKLKKVAVIGQNADTFHANGGGSAEIRAFYEIPPLMGLKMRLGGNVEVQYAPGYPVPVKKQTEEENWQKDSIEAEQVAEEKSEKKTNMKKADAEELSYAEERKRLLREAVALAKSCDQVIFVGGLNHDLDVEGGDRSDMKLPYCQDEVIEALLKVRPDMIVVIHAGSSVEMPWSRQAKAILWSYYSGMETGTALADILLGNVNPSGKLAETFPVQYADTPTGKNGQFALMHQVKHEEGVYVGYRYYEHEAVKPAFCFGHGLSYTDFTYHALKAEVLFEAHEGGEDAKSQVDIKLQLTVRNTGNRAGAEIVQIYVGKEDSAVDRPRKELRAFEKIYLEPGEEKQVCCKLTERSFSFYNEEKGCFHCEPGEYQIYAGASSEDIRLKGKVELKNVHFFR